jgi:hypothetical protein
VSNWELLKFSSKKNFELSKKDFWVFWNKIGGLKNLLVVLHWSSYSLSLPLHANWN